MEQVRAEPDARIVIALWVQTCRAVFVRVAPIMRVIRDAAVGDPDMASQWATNEQQRDASYRLLVQQLAERGALKIDLSANEAADRAFALLSVELCLLLTTTTG